MNLLKASVVAILTLLLLQARNAPGAEADKSNTSVSAEFEAMLEKVDAAQLELQKGKPAAFKALWSQADASRCPAGSEARWRKGGMPSAAASIG